MDWIERMNGTLDEIEKRLTGTVDTAELARLACLSPFYFQRVFACMTDTTVGEYVRRRRMSLAAAELQAGGRVLDVALKYGYESPTAFSRAFRQVHGIAPSEARRNGARLKNYPPIRFQITIKGAVEMNYRIVPMEAFTVLGKERVFQMDTAFEEIPRFWDEYYQKGYYKTVCGQYGICVDGLDGSKEFRYLIGDNCEPEAPVPEGFQKRVIPAFDWAVFEDHGALPGALQKLNRRIYTEWLPNIGEYEIAAGYNVERYTEGDMTSDGYRFEIWLPVKKK